MHHGAAGGHSYTGGGLAPEVTCCAMQQVSISPGAESVRPRLSPIETWSVPPPSPSPSLVSWPDERDVGDAYLMNTP